MRARAARRSTCGRAVSQILPRTHRPLSRARTFPAAQYVCVALGGIRPSANLQLLPQNLSHVPSSFSLLNIPILSYFYFR